MSAGLEFQGVINLESREQRRRRFIGQRLTEKLEQAVPNSCTVLCKIGRSAVPSCIPVLQLETEVVTAADDILRTAPAANTARLVNSQTKPSVKSEPLIWLGHIL